MTNIYDLDEWELDKSVPNAKRMVDVSISFKYPDPMQFIEFKPKDRIRKINDEHKENLKKLLELKLFDQHTVEGTKKRPSGVNAKVKYSSLAVLKKLDFLGVVSIKSIDHAVHVKKNIIPPEPYFCVKMTVVIEIEGVSSKKQDIEERFVLIKAESFEHAYELLEKQKATYAEPYLNPRGRFVRWRIESFDDCFHTWLSDLKDLDAPEGVEVYSKLKSRKTKTKTIWDGRP